MECFLFHFPLFSRFRDSSGCGVFIAREAVVPWSFSQSREDSPRLAEKHCLSVFRAQGWFGVQALGPGVGWQGEVLGVEARAFASGGFASGAAA